MPGRALARYDPAEKALSAPARVCARLRTMSPPIAVTVDAHPLLDAVVFETRFPSTLAGLGFPLEIGELLSPSSSSNAPLTSNDEVRGVVRDLLRHGGYKPTGRGKPASEYLLCAVAEGTLSRINAAVDTCNAVSFHSGLPISVVDRALVEAPMSIRIAPGGTDYVFNASGQTIDVAGLLCLFDAAGACANAVKDSQRTKTRPETTETITVIWGSRGLVGRTARAFAWYEELLTTLGAVVTRLELGT